MTIREVFSGILPAMLAGVLILAACRDDTADEVGDQIDSDVIGSPTAAPGLSEDIERVTIAISDGEFDVGQIELIEERPTVLTVENSDDVAYWLEIGDLVNGTEIPAGETVNVEFTTPVEDVYTGELLSEQGGEVLDEMDVEVIGPVGEP